MRSFSLMTVVGILSLVGLSSNASAMQGRLGEECNVWAGPSCSISYGSCENHGSSTMYADCPLVRLGTSSVSGYVFARDYNSSADVRCRLCSIRYMNSSRLSSCSAWQSTAGNSGSNTWLSFSSMSTADNYYNLYYECEVPPASGSSYSAINAFYFYE